MNASRADLSFPKRVRLLRRDEYRRVYDEGRRRSAPLCTAFFLSNGLAQTRLGITVPRAIGNACARNRIRRRLREVFRLHRAAICSGWDVVLNPRPPVATIPFETLAREVLRLFPSAPPPRTPAAPSSPRPAASAV
ncbi:MAG TPA: ribonuclease P protein component [Terriglobia bacterium]|nr:ribonuclease P protein component [Terriglobia bacterium]